MGEEKFVIAVVNCGHVRTVAQAVPDGALVPLPRRRVSVLFDRIAEDFEGDQIFWRLLGDLLPGLRADDAIRVP